MAEDPVAWLEESAEDFIKRYDDASRRRDYIRKGRIIDEIDAHLARIHELTGEVDDCASTSTGSGASADGDTKADTTASPNSSDWSTNRSH